MAEDRRRCAEAGMDGYLSKPLRPAELHSELASASGEQPDVNADAAAASEVKPAPSENSDPDGLIDWQHARKTTLNDDELLADIIEAVLVELPDLMQKLDTAIEDANGKDIHRAAHTVNCLLYTSDAADE